MCHPQQNRRQLEVRKARKVVKKYRQMSYKKEMNRLRHLLAADETVSESMVLDRTVSLIEELEARLMSQLRSGNVPLKMASIPGVEWSQCSQQTVRDMVGALMMTPPQ